MKKISLTQNELCEYGVACELRRLVLSAKTMLENCDCFPEDLWDTNDELLDALDKANSEYYDFLRKVDKIPTLAELNKSDDLDDLNVSPF